MTESGTALLCINGPQAGLMVGRRRGKPNVSFVCDACGKHVEKYVAPSHQRRGPARQFCNPVCAGQWRTGENHPRWNGGRYADADGYICVRAAKHPFARKHGVVFEHRLVMEAALGRYLTREEVVHHENGIKGDNRIENLRLFSSQKEHKRYHGRDEAGRFA